MRLALHWMLLIEPSPSWRTDILHRFNQFLSYRSSFEKKKILHITYYISAPQMDIMSGVSQPGLQRAVDEQHIAQEQSVGDVWGWNDNTYLTETVGNLLIHAANDEVKTQIQFLHEDLNSTSKHLGTKTMKTNCSLDSIWVRRLHISFTFSGGRSHFTGSHGRCNLQVEDGCESQKERVENLMHYKHHLVHPSSPHHNGYTPFIVAAVGGNTYRNTSS